MAAASINPYPNEWLTLRPAPLTSHSLADLPKNAGLAVRTTVKERFIKITFGRVTSSGLTNMLEIAPRQIGIGFEHERGNARRQRR